MDTYLDKEVKRDAEDCVQCVWQDRRRHFVSEILLGLEVVRSVYCPDFSSPLV